MSAPALRTGAVVDERPRYVPDGEPCPRHGLPSRLLWIQHVRDQLPVSQCAACIDEFWAEQAAVFRPRAEALRELVANQVITAPPTTPAIVPATAAPPEQLGFTLDFGAAA